MFVKEEKLFTVHRGRLDLWCMLKDYVSRKCENKDYIVIFVQTMQLVQDTETRTRDSYSYS